RSRPAIRSPRPVWRRVSRPRAIVRGGIAGDVNRARIQPGAIVEGSAAGDVKHAHNDATASGRAARLVSTVAVAGRSYSAGCPRRLIQKTRKPNSVAPNASHALEDTKAIRSGSTPNRAVASP